MNRGAEPGEAKLEQSELRGAILEQPVADVQVQRVAFVVQIRDEQILVAVAIDVCRVDAHAPLRLPRPIHGHACQQRIVFEDAGATLVDPQLVRVAVVGDVQIGPAVAVEVGRQDAESSRRTSAPMPGARGDVGEGSVAIVVQQPVGHRVVDDGIAVVARGAGGKAPALHVRPEVDVVGDEQIEPAVPVVVEEGRARAPARIVGARFARSRR